MQPFTRESLLIALEKIDANPELRKGRESIEYDLIYNQKSYPPILVLSEANKALGGQEINMNDFGNSTRKAFKIIHELGFEIIGKEMPITKDAILEIIGLCQTMADGRKDGTITLNTYTEKFKPLLTQFQNKHGESPGLILQNQLKIFISSQLRDVSTKVNLKNFGYWGRSIYNYTWSCIYYNFGQVSMAASFSPQLYILINKDGIKFGFCYGHQLESENKLVQSALIPQNLEILEKCLQNDIELCFYNATKDEVTARPEKLFGKNERIDVSSDEDIINNWSSSSLLIKEFPKSEIPENIGEIVQGTFSNLKQFYLGLLPIKKNVENVKNENLEIPLTPLQYRSFYNSTKEANLKFSEKIIIRFIASLCTKPFVICSGLSGSGKTKLAQSFVQWICESEEQYKIVPVGADWTNREPLLGFPNGLDPVSYVFPDSGVLQLILDAINPKNENKPYFLILDEMNLSHVERYFADFLSIMESKDKIKLYSGHKRGNVPQEISWPKNLFIIGTVNIDETTYMFSPKVLDRANVIEFRISDKEIEDYLNNPGDLDMQQFYDANSKKGYGSSMAFSFLEKSKEKAISAIDTKEIFFEFFKELKMMGAEFGYRSASEISRLISILDTMTKDDNKWDDATINSNELIDIAIMQKLLPKLHGSRNKLTKVLPVLGALCLTEREKIKEKYFEKIGSINFVEDENIKYKISFEKICRMYKNAIDNGFASYAEA